MDLQPPSVLAQLPHPFEATAGSTRIAEAYTLTGSKKRKRHDVAAAIDGEGVNIYNVQSPKLITSYPVPPQSSFSCPPCSIRRKISQGTAVKRQTYCAVERPEKQVQCFSDESLTSASTSSKISTSSFQLKGVDSPVIFLGVVPAASAERDPDDCFDILLIHKDGHTRRLTSDLSAQKWCILPNTISSGKDEVHAAFLVDFEDAQKYLLRRRQDIIATILGDNPDAASKDTSTSILLLVTHPTQSTTLRPSDIQVQLFSVPAADRTDAFSSLQAHRMNHLMTVKLPELEDRKDLNFQKPRWDFHSGSAGLNVSFERGFINYDLSQYAPSVSSHLVVENEEFHSLMRISPRSIIGASQSSIAIYDTQYQSIQASITRKAGNFVDIPSLGDHKSPVTLVTYYSKLGIAVALCGHILFGLDVTSSSALRPTSLKRPRDGLLINAIGRGTGSARQQHAEPLKSKKKLDAFAESRDSVAFDNLMKSELVRPAKAEKDSGASDPTAPDAMPSRDDFVDPEKVFYLLSKIFSFRRGNEGVKHDNDISHSPCLVISIAPRETFNWLLDSGRLTIDNIEIALRRSTRPQVLPNLPGGALMQAIRDYDPSLKLLLQVLDSPQELSSDELTHALQIFLEIARSSASNSYGSANALTNTPHDTNQALEARAKPSGASHKATKTLLSASFSPLNLTLAKLHTQPLTKVTRSLRTILSNTETIAIINHLRHALAMGGYTSRFTENLPYASTTQPNGENHAIKPPTLALSTIIDLLTVSVDAIGPTGWISVTPNTVPDNVIADMKSEISAALAGVEEASYLKGILREFIRCAGTGSDTTPQLDQKSSQKQQQRTRGIKHEKLNGADLLTFPTGTAMDIDQEDGNDENNISNTTMMDDRILPLSLKMAHSQTQTGIPSANDEGGSSIVSKTKINKSTGEVLNRSNREIGYLKRKAAGKYSFERIIV